MIVLIEGNNLFKEDDVAFHVILNVYSIPEAEDFLINNGFVDVDNDYFRWNPRCRCCGGFHAFEKYDFEDPDFIIDQIERTHIFVNPNGDKVLARVYDVKNPEFSVLCKNINELKEVLEKND